MATITRPTATVPPSWVAIAMTIARFHRVNPVAAWLLVPYLAWVTFATALTAAIVRMN